MFDGWIDRKGRTLINFLVHYPRDTMFIKSVDAFTHVKDATLLCEFLNGFLQEINLANVVQMITDNATNYVAIGGIVMDMHHSIFWIPRATHCIDLMLKDMEKFSFFKEVIYEARNIPKFIYSHAFVLSLMRKCNKNKELQRLSIT